MRFKGTADPRQQIINVLDDTLSRNKNGSYRANVMIVEIDAFQILRQHKSGKEIRHILHIIENRLKGDFLTQDVVRKLDGDQFAIAVNPVRAMSRAELLKLATSVQDTIFRPISFASGTTQISVSIGCARSGEIATTTGEDLLEAAHVAQVAASNQGPSTIRTYSSAMGTRIETRGLMLSEALKAIKSGDIQAFFQPQICLTTNLVSGFEALARWNHQARGLISPAEFLPVLEEAGMMRHLGLAMLRDSLRALRSWDDARLNVPQVSVNMSAVELRDPNLVEIIKFELDAFDLAPARLVIEILETVVARDANDPIIRNLHAISALGCGIDLDDFGTGHASVATLKSFAVKRIKIDRSFVSHVDDDENQQQMVAMILVIANGLAIETLAEGVETAHEIQHLAANGCGHAQGFAIARPLAPTDTIAWLRQREAPSASFANASFLH